MKTLSTERFIEISKNVHGNKYDYTLVSYINSKTKVKIICPIHGVFEQVPEYHMKGCNCKLCVNNNIKLTNNEFIGRAKEVHGVKYTYDNVSYDGMNHKIKINCPAHGIFEQMPYRHLLGDGCSKCSNNYSDLNYFIENSNKIHKNKYDYTLVNYINNKAKVKIICPFHGVFNQRPDNHINGQNCPKCGQTISHMKIRKKYCDVIVDFNLIHNYRYDYSLVEYKNNKTKIKIICHKHGVFLQTPNKHNQGSGCPKCYCSKGEEEIIKKLMSKRIFFEKNYSFDDCKDINCLPFDFYLPDYKICIEYDGIQHFKPIEFWGGENGLMYIKKHDKIKNDYCVNKNIKLLRIKYNEKISKIIEDNIF